MKEVKTDYFRALTGLRTVAVLLVAVHHFNPFAPEKFGWRLHNLAAEMHIGVTVFFVLSGFLIGYRYLAQPVALRTYFANRFARIYPLYFLLSTLTFMVWWSKGQSFSLTDYLLNISFLRGLFQQHVYSGIAQGWSLTVEEMFYASTPLAFLLIRRRWWWLLALPVLLAGAGAGLVAMSRQLDWHGFFASFDFLFQFTYLGRALEFFAGVALAWWLRRMPTRRAPRGITYAGVAGTLLCLGGLSALHGPTVGDFGVLKPIGMVINNVALPLLGIGPLLWGLVREETWLRHLLGTPLLVLLGKSSYAFYLIHMGMLQQLLRERIDSPLLVLVLLYVVAIVLYEVVEEPLNKWLRRVLSGGIL